MAHLICGVDEAGRGPLAGPVVAAAVVLCPGGIAGLDDSKKLSARRRATLERAIKARCLWAVAEASVAEIDAINILQATMLAMTRAVDALAAEILTDRHAELVSASMAQGSDQAPWTLKQVQGDANMFEILVDGNRLPQWRYSARAIIGGDALEPAISAASILAKQHRDRIMMAADADFPGYGWASNKGYGSAQHLAALRHLGPTPLHRRSFAPVAQHFFAL